MRTLIWIFIIILFPFLTSCDPCLGVGNACADSFYFRIVDKVNHQDLVFGPGPVYQKDSVYLFTKLTGFLGAMSSIDSNKFMSNLLLPVDTFYLHLNSADTDTLLMNYDFRKSYCCKSGHGFGKITGINYNGLPASKQGDTFIFVKSF